MPILQSDCWTSTFKNDNLRLERSFAFETPEASEYFAEEAGASIAFSTISTFVEPVFGEPVARVVIECQRDQLSVATATHLAAAFEELHASRGWNSVAA